MTIPNTSDEQLKPLIVRLREAAKAAITAHKDAKLTDRWDKVDCAYDNLWRNHCQPQTITQLCASHEALVEALKDSLMVHHITAKSLEEEGLRASANTILKRIQPLELALAQARALEVMP